MVTYNKKAFYLRGGPTGPTGPKLGQKKHTGLYVGIVGIIEAVIGIVL